MTRIAVLAAAALALGGCCRKGGRGCPPPDNCPYSSRVSDTESEQCVKGFTSDKGPTNYGRLWHDVFGKRKKQVIVVEEPIGEAVELPGPTRSQN